MNRDEVSMQEQRAGEATLLQLQQQFQQLMGQFDRVRRQVDDLHTTNSQSSHQFATLLEHLTAGDQTSPLLEQIAEMATALNATQSQLEELTQRTARQEQLERLVEVVAGQTQMDEVAENLKKLTRTQFKSNTLGESKSGQVEQALSTLRALATQRETVQQEQGERANQQVADAHQSGRAEFALELIPALDSIELAVTNGADLLARQQDRITQLPANEPTTALTAPSIPTEPQPTGFWQRLFGSAEAPIAPTPASPTSAAAPAREQFVEFAQSTEQSINAWLDGLTLVSERLIALLAAEEIQPIEAFHQPFDPQLHVAVESAVHTDVPPNTVVRVLRQGYRRQDRVIRYAEVVVARGADA